MTKFEEIEQIENKKTELWEKKNNLYKEISKINQELENCDHKIAMLTTKSESRRIRLQKKILLGG